MTRMISIDSLTTCLVTPDGARIRLNFANFAGEATTLEVSTSCVQQLVNTLPHLLTTALRVQHGDHCARDSTAWALQ
jgi:hypothetical protein